MEPVDITSEHSKSVLKNLWKKFPGTAWEPRDHQHPFILAAIEAGYFKRSDGRCGFERLKDAFISWTPAAIHAMTLEFKSND